MKIKLSPDFHYNLQQKKVLKAQEQLFYFILFFCTRVDQATYMFSYVEQ